MLDAAVTDPDCWNLSPGAPPPFSEGYLMTVARDLIIRSTYPGTIPTCPTMAPLDIVFTSATCGEWATRVVDPDGPGGTPEVLERYISWCSDVACTRSCEVCVNPNDPDPCDDNKPRLNFQCAPYYNPGCPGVPLPTNCQNFCGS